MSQFRIRYFFVLMFILGIYIGAPLSWEVLPIPAFVAGIAGCVLLVLNINYLKKQHLQLFFFLMLLMIPGVLTNAGDNMEIQRLRGVLQLFYSIIISLGAFLELKKWNEKQVAHLFYSIAVLIIFGCFLENFTSFRDVSDNFRSYAFEKHLYNAEFRDELIFGRVRPKLFTAEPSYVALFLFLSLTMWYSLTENKFASLGLCSLTLSGMLLIGSPIITLTLFALIPNYLYPNKCNKIKPVSEIKPVSANKWKWGKLLFGAILLGAIFFLAFNGILKARFEQVTHGEDDSFTGRITAPPRIAYSILSQRPFWGVGMGAKGLVEDNVFEVFTSMDVYMDPNTDELINAVTNAFWLHWIFLGLFGGVLMTYWMYKLINVLGIKYKWQPIFLTIISWQAMGGYVDPRSWFFFFMFILVSLLRLGKLNRFSNNPVGNRARLARNI